MCTYHGCLLDSARRAYDECLNVQWLSCRLDTGRPLHDGSSAIGALTGPLHGGANEQALRMFREIGTVENVRPYIEAS